MYVCMYVSVAFNCASQKKERFFKSGSSLTCGTAGPSESRISIAGLGLTKPKFFRRNLIDVGTL
jgi:hypothetical protein